MPMMKTIELRTQLFLVAAGYGAALAAAAAMVAARYVLYITHPADVNAAGGMYAAGDTMLGVFIYCMLLVPTAVLAVVLRNSETLYTRYSKALLGVSLTAPICLGVLTIPAVAQGPMIWGEICMDRLLASPFIIGGLGFSRLFARFAPGKRLTVYALLVEGLTFAFALGLLLFSFVTHRS